ncbi:MAG TPA: hypothetical protein VF787_05390 [Thermoanaerobaculia bacterium]
MRNAGLSQSNVRALRYDRRVILSLLATLAISLSDENLNHIPASERSALLALYASTQGDRWKSSEGWGGSPGTECDWWGVECMPDETGQKHVISINLPANNLRGRIPEAMEALTHLQTLMLQSNAIEGTLPESMLERWDAGTLDLRYGTSYSTIEEISFVYLTEVCGAESVRIKRDGSIEWQRERCATPKADNPRLSCEIKRGRTLHLDRLARLMEHGFFDLPDLQKGAGWIDVPITTIRATRNGVTTTREIGLRGSGSLAE